MMNDFISRQAAIAAIHELKMSVSGYDNDALDVSLIYEVLGEIPAADVQPVKRARWIIRKCRMLPYCSACGSEPVAAIMTKYCPNCGALMQDE